MITDVIIINVSVIVLKSSRQCSNEAFKVVTKQKKNLLSVNIICRCARSQNWGAGPFSFLKNSQVVPNTRISVSFEVRRKFSHTKLSLSTVKITLNLLYYCCSWLDSTFFVIDTNLRINFPIYCFYFYSSSCHIMIFCENF